MEITRQTKVKANPNFIHRSVAGNDVLISIGSNIANLNGYIEINEVGAFVWKHMKEETTIQELINVVINEYEVSEEKAFLDLAIFMKELEENGMLGD